MSKAVDEELTQISQRIRSRRELANLTLQELAKRSGVDPSERFSDVGFRVACAI